MKKHDYEIVKVDLPYSDWIMGLGISSIAFSFATGIIGIVLGILAIYLYPKPYALYKLAPELYFENSYRNIKVGRTLGIIGLILSSIVFLCFLIIFVIVRGFVNLIS
jgi:hypothetical protein